MRLIRPELKAFKLKSLLAELGLEGENSHLADDDVNATVSLVNYCHEMGLGIIKRQEEFLDKPTVKSVADKLRRDYGDIYFAACDRLYDRGMGGEPALTAEMNRFYHFLIEERRIKPNSKINYVSRFLDSDVINQAEEPSLKEQLENHIMEISTF